MDKKIDLLHQFIQGQLEQIERVYLRKKKAVIIRDAWKLGRYQDIADAIIYWCENWEEDDTLDNFYLKPETIDKILCCKRNVLEYLLDNFSNVHHYERYNLDDWEEDLPFLINSVMEWEK